MSGFDPLTAKKEQLKAVFNGFPIIGLSGFDPLTAHNEALLLLYKAFFIFKLEYSEIFYYN